MPIGLLSLDSIMTETVSDWMSYTGCEPKRNRAKLACIFCHSKKIKCDLQVRIDRGCSKCSKCDTTGRECRPRPSRRSKHRPSISSAGATDQSSIGPLISEMSLPEPVPDCASIDQMLDSGLVEQPVNSAVRKMNSPQSIHPSNTSVTSSASGVAGKELRSSFVHRAANVGVTTTHVPLTRGSIAVSSQPAGSPTEGAGRSHAGDVDTGFLQIYGPENEFDAERQEFEASLDTKPNLSDPQQQELLQSFAETYFEYCYPWCPVLNRDTLPEELTRSGLLANALATAASHIQPPLVPHEGPASYYKKATGMFYNDEETDMVMTMKAVSLFYWWAPRPPTTAHRHASWWWTSVIIRHAQQMNFHREPGPNHPFGHRLDLSLRRRIWWTVFARERITALCQSKPCIIDPEDCSIAEPTLADFPSDPVCQKKGEIFIHWVRLCGIMGKVAKALSRSSSTTFTGSSPLHLRQELVQWVESLPEHLRLPIQSARTWSFDRDVHQLHLPYLTTIIILHLKRSPHALPQALPPAILAASCIARILRDILSRGNARFLMAVTCWYAGTAFIALLQASRIQELSKEANEGLDVLDHAVGQLQQMWGSANVIRQGFERLRSSYTTAASSNIRYVDSSTGQPVNTSIAGGEPFETGSTASDIPNQDGFDWTELFPFVTPATNKIAEVLLSGKEHGTVTRLPSPDDLLIQDTLFSQYQDLLEPWTDYIFDISEMASQPWSNGI